MQVILLENVENLGRIGDLVNVTDGYARNFLLPRKLVATADARLMEKFPAGIRAYDLLMDGEEDLRALSFRTSNLETTRCCRCFSTQRCQSSTGTGTN